MILHHEAHTVRKLDALASEHPEHAAVSAQTGRR
jgi:hypothetical protein